MNKNIKLKTVFCVIAVILLSLVVSINMNVINNNILKSMSQKKQKSNIGIRARIVSI